MQVDYDRSSLASKSIIAEERIGGREFQSNGFFPQNLANVSLDRRHQVE